MRLTIISYIVFACCVSLHAQKPCDPTGDNDPLTHCPKQHPYGDYDPDGKLSYDPNEIIGPTGVDSVRWISINDILNYTIMFENDPEFATAAAQRVDVRFDFPNKALQKNFGIGTYCFSNMSYNVENSPNAYQNRINLVDSLGIYVDVIGGLDVTQNQGFWDFSTIDPETGYAPWEHDKCLLQVNDSTHVGEGFVTFSLKPLANMQTGDTISIQARIVFDDNDTIPTNRWCNMIDAGMPVSKTIAAINPDNPSVYNISFESSDDKGGSGVDKIALYLANNSGLYEEYGVYAPDSIVSFPIEQGKQYKLFSIATDRTGNMEPLKEEPDVVVNFNQPPTDLLLSNTIFQDDVELDGFIAELSTVDDDDDVDFTYSLAEGDGSIHNDMFAVVGNRLQANDCFKCANDTIYNIRLSTTDNGGLSFSKAFTLKMLRVLDEPEPKVYDVNICEGGEYEFFGEYYDKTGTYIHREPNDFMCDSIHVLNLRVNPIPEPPTITISGKATLTSSAERGNQWYKDGEPIDDATEQVYVATETGFYYVTASNGSCESDPSEEVYVNLAEIGSIEYPLERGWNWLSSNISENSIQEPKTFFASILGSLNTVRSANGRLNSDGTNISGDIEAITPATYQIQMNSSDNLTLSGAIHQPEDFEISLSTGWNWIPYIPTVEMGLDIALSNLTPSEDDVIKSHSQFATYSDGKWIGTLTDMQPNNGYMYYTAKANSFTFSSSRARNVSHEPMYLAETSAPWHPDKNAYADNLTMIAELYDADVKVLDGTFAVGAFCGNECRGIGEYIDGHLFFTIHGNPNDNIKFKTIENATGSERDVNESLTLGEHPIGTYSAPYRLTLGKSSGIDNVYSYDLNIYPNPVRDIMFIEGDVTDVTGVKVITVSGITLISTDSFEHGVNVTTIPDGVYVAAILTTHGVTYRKFIKKGY